MERADAVSVLFELFQSLQFDVAARTPQMEKKLQITRNFTCTSYCSLLVAEESDLESAVEELASGWKNLGIPWAIRDCLVAEKILDRFLEILRVRLRSIIIPPEYEADETLVEAYKKDLERVQQKNFKLVQTEDPFVTLKPTFVVGPNRNGLPSLNSPLVTLQVFRTIREGVELLNKVNGGSAAVYCENISVAMEAAKQLNVANVWINCNGVFDAEFPFQFNGEFYGSRLRTLLNGGEGGKKIEEIPKEHLYFSQSKFEKNVFFSTTCEENTATGGLPYRYKTLAVRFGSTFSN